MARRRISRARNHEANDTPRYGYEETNRVAPLDSPGRVVTTPKQNAHFITGQDRGCRAYAEMLERQLPREPAPPAGLRLASFFCGCGGLDLGFRSAGFETAFANDLHARAAESFEANLGHAPLVKDIREVRPGDVPEVDVLAGGFPCVTFSTAGKRAGVEDSTDGMLYRELCRVIGERRPRYFVAENVKGMLSSGGGRDVKLILAAFLRLGYRTTCELVNMAEHGVPQTRERVIFVGVRVDQWRGRFRYPERTHRLRRDGKARKWLPLARTLREAIGDLPDVVGMMHGDAAEKRRRGGGVSGFHNSQPRGVDDPSHSQTTRANVLLTRNPQHYNQNRDWIGSQTRPGAPTEPDDPMSDRYRRPRSTDEPAHTQIAANPAKLHGQLAAPEVPPNHDQKEAGMRRMTVRECARVQSFPDWFEFSGSMSDGYKQVGNAVPPLYAKRLARAILEYDRRRTR